MGDEQKTKEFLDNALKEIRYICGVDQHDPDYESIQIEPILRSIFDHGVLVGRSNPYSLPNSEK